MANWKWADKLLGKEEVYEDDIPYDTDNYTAEQPAVPQAPRQNSAVSGGAAAALEMKIVKPEKFEEVTGIADHLLARRTVVLNLENTSKETVRRIVDFLSGTAYALEGKIKRVANSTYVITPNNVEVSADMDAHASAQKELF